MRISDCWSITWDRILFCRFGEHDKLEAYPTGIKHEELEAYPTGIKHDELEAYPTGIEHDELEA